MLDAEKLKKISENTDIIENGVNDADDSIIKALELLNDLKSKYAFTPFSDPSSEVSGEVNRPTPMGTNTGADSAFVWTSHYKKIMLKLDMIEDYLLKGARGTAAVFNGMNGVNRAAGLTLTSYLEGLEKVEAAQ